MKIRRFLKILPISIGIFAVTLASAYSADFAGTPTSYKVTVNKVEFFNSTTSVWVTVGSGDQEFDLASVSAGAVAGSYASGNELTEGTYTQMRTTASRTIKLTGSVADGGTTYYTTGGTDTVINDASGDGLQVIDASTTAGDLAEGTLILGTTGITLATDTNYFVITQNITSFTVSQGSSLSSTVSFDVTGTLVGNADTVGRPYIASSEPTVTVAVS